MIGAKSMREKGIEPSRQIKAADPKSTPYPAVGALKAGSARTGPQRAAEHRAEDVREPVTRGRVTKSVTRLPVKFCWTCGRRYRGTIRTCATCPVLKGWPLPPRAPLGRATRRATSWRDGSRFGSSVETRATHLVPPAHCASKGQHGLPEIGHPSRLPSLTDRGAA